MPASPTCQNAGFSRGGYQHDPPQFHFNPLSWSRFTFPPLSTQTTFDPAGALISPCNSAATGAAAAPSTTSLQCDMTQIIASKISLSGSVTMSSTKRCTMEKLFSPTRFTRSPSMMQSILSSVTTCPASMLRFMPGPSEDSTPMILIFGFNCFSAMDTPEISPPPPIGTTATSICGKSSYTSSPSVPWPAMSCRSSKGWMYVYPRSCTSCLAFSLASSQIMPCCTTSAPYARVASTLDCVALLAITTTALIP